MEIIQTEDFAVSLKKLPRRIQKIYLGQENRFARNWRDQRLHVKKVKSLEHAFSFRITRHYRVFFFFQNNSIAVFFDIGHRKDIYE